MLDPRYLPCFLRPFLFPTVVELEESSEVGELEEILDSASDTTKNLAESLEPLEKQLEDLLDELNTTLRPKIEKPVRARPLLAIGMATGIGIILGILLSGGKRS